MKTITFKNSVTSILRQTILFITSTLLLLSCSNDDNANPIPVEEEETITTITITLVQEGVGEPTILQSKDLDGDGPNAPEISISGNLATNASYNGTIVLLNETESPAKNVTEEVKEEDDEHQFFFNATGSLIGTSYADTDENGNPIGLAFILNTGDAGNATLTVTLRHQPKKPNDGTLADAGGETDIAQTFNVKVE